MIFCTFFKQFNCKAELFNTFDFKTMQSSDKKKGKAATGGNIQKRVRDVDATAHLRREVTIEGLGSARSIDSSDFMGAEIPENITVFFTSDKLIIRSQSRLNDCIVVDRRTEQIRVDSSSSTRTPVVSTRQNYYGLLGQIRLFGSTYLIFVSRRQRVGREAQHTVWKLTGVNFVKIKEGRLELPAEQERMNSRVIYLLIQILTEGEFIFAYNFDFTHTVQRLHSLIGPDNLTKPIFKRGDHRFIWNKYLAENLVQIEGIADYLVPLMRGYFASNKCHLNGQDFTLMIVSRVGASRAGVRYYSRGLDMAGNVANFVETEIILETPKDRYSFVQTRSSPPFIWKQRPNLRNLPKPKIKHKEYNMAAFTQHFDIQSKIYGPHLLLDIMSRSGIEGHLADFYSHLVVRCGSTLVEYIPLPFKNMEQMLVDLSEQNIIEEVTKNGFVSVTGGKKIMSTQKGIVRTTGFDSIDRTNLVQCLISSHMLRDMLIRAGVFRVNDELEFYGKFKRQFYGMWADNGDTLSKIYCGSLSLTSDSLRGSSFLVLKTRIRRWYILATRYYMNNFCHGGIQDSLNTLTGRFIPIEALKHRHPIPGFDPSDEDANRSENTATYEHHIDDYDGEDIGTPSFFSRYVTTIVPFFLAFTVSNFAVFIIRVGEEPIDCLICSTLWLVASVTLFTVTVMCWGRHFVDTPKFTKRYSRRHR